MYSAFMFLLVVSSLATALGIAYYAEPELFNWFFDWLDLSEAERAYFTTAITATTVMGWSTRVLKQVVNTDNLKRDAIHQTELSLLQKRHSFEMSTLKSDFAELIKVDTENVNEVIANQNVLIEQNQQIINERRLNATRMLQMSDDLVPIEIKASYKDFLKSTETPIISRLSNFYVDSVEIVEKVVEKVVNERKTLSERLKGNGEVSNL